MDSNGSLRPMKRSTSFYITGGDLFFVVGEYTFRVHSYFFTRESQLFKDRLAISEAGMSLEGNGSSMTSAIILSDDFDITPEEFESFLKVFYNPRYSYYQFEQPQQEWASILKLSNLWGFSNVKELAIEQLQYLDVPLVDRIVLYQDYQVGWELLAPLYVDLASRESTLDHEESRRLGFRTAIVIFQARERLRSLAMGGRSPLPDDVGPEAAKEVISNIFDSVGPEPSFTPPTSPKAKLNGFGSPGRKSSSVFGSPRSNGFAFSGGSHSRNGSSGGFK